MSLEARVGGFLLLGLLLLGGFIFKLGDVTLARQYSIDVSFKDVSGLPDKSVVKLSGVEVGKVVAIDLVADRAIVRLRINQDIKIYKDAVFRIGSTSVIGSKFLQIDQGHPSAGVLQPGDSVNGSDAQSLERTMTDALAKLQGVLDDLHTNLAPGGALMGSMTASVQNLREMTANMNDLIQDVKPQLDKSMKRTDDITLKLDQLLGKTNELMAKLNSSSGTVGALVSDTQMKDQVKDTVNNFHTASQSVKEVLGRFGQYRVFWNFTARNDQAADDTKGDGGLRIEPRPGRYYYLGGEDLGADSKLDKPRGVDYETPNTVDALLGWYGNWWDVFGGAIKSSFGFGTRVIPFYGVPFMDRFVLFAEAENFSRNGYVYGRLINKPEYDAGLEFKVNQYFKVGGRVQDIVEIPRYETTANLSFEDKDVAYLFGLMTFAASGIKNTSNTNNSN